MRQTIALVDAFGEHELIESNTRLQLDSFVEKFDECNVNRESLQPDVGQRMSSQLRIFCLQQNLRLVFFPLFFPLRECRRGLEVRRRPDAQTLRRFAKGRFRGNYFFLVKVKSGKIFPSNIGNRNWPLTFDQLLSSWANNLQCTNNRKEDTVSRYHCVVKDYLQRVKSEEIVCTQYVNSSQTKPKNLNFLSLQYLVDLLM